MKSVFMATAFGQTRSVVEWSQDSRCVVSYDTLLKRIQSDWPPESAIQLPKGTKLFPAEPKITETSCVVCGEMFQAVNKGKYCSEECRCKAQAARRREVREARIPKYRYCHCGKQHTKQQHCSRRCSNRWNKIRYAQRKFSVLGCRGCGEVFIRVRGAPSDYCSNQCRRAHHRYPHTCNVCGCRFETGTRESVRCSDCLKATRFRLCRCVWCLSFYISPHASKFCSKRCHGKHAKLRQRLQNRRERGTRRCDACSQVFWPKSTQQRCCGPECSSSVIRFESSIRASRPIGLCVRCGQPWAQPGAAHVVCGHCRERDRWGECQWCRKPVKGREAWAIPDFCGRRCALQYNGQAVTQHISCQQCGQEFKQQYRKQRFCTRDCFHASAVEAECEICGTVFEGPVNAIKRTCSYECNRIANRPKERVASSNRRARKRSLPDDWTTEDKAQALQWWNHSCAYCSRTVDESAQRRTESTLHWDHVIPLAADDCPGTVPGNMVPACERCNESKNAKPLGLWLEEVFPDQAKAILEKVRRYSAELDQPLPEVITSGQLMLF